MPSLVLLMFRPLLRTAASVRVLVTSWTVLMPVPETPSPSKLTLSWVPSLVIWVSWVLLSWVLSFFWSSA